MAWWKMSESIYFDWILSDLFDWWGSYDDAFCEWSDDKWRSEFAEKLALRKYSDDINVSSWREFERFLVYRREEQEQQKAKEKLECREKEDEKFWEEMEREYEALVWEEKEQKHLKQEQGENKEAEEKAREQKKAKQLPEVIELIEQYQQTREALGEEPSEEKYHKLFNVCYSIINSWRVLGCLDEFDGIFKYYEKCVLEYLDSKKTVDSLYHVVIYYTDKNLVWEIADLPARKAHIQKGIPYAELLYQTLGSEDSAERYVECYLMMTQFCGTGEDLEELSYADKAYKLAKKFVSQFKSERMMEEFETAMLGMTVYYRTHEQEEEAKKVEEEFEKIKNQIIGEMEQKISISRSSYDL